MADSLLGSWLIFVGIVCFLNQGLVVGLIVFSTLNYIHWEAFVFFWLFSSNNLLFLI